MAGITEELEKSGLLDIAAKMEGRVLEFDSIQYLICKIDIKTNKLSAIPLYCSVGVAVDIDYHYERKELTFYKIANLKGPLIVHSASASEKLLKEQQENCHNLVIYYKTGSTNFENYNEAEIIPYSVKPFGIRLDDFNIGKEGTKITSVRSKLENLKVRCKSLLLSYEMGFMNMNPIELFVTFVNKNIQNITHIHLEDMSEAIAIDSIVVEDEDDLQKHAVFKNDLHGKELNYKVIFKGHKLWKMLYNLGGGSFDEPDFVENKLNEGNIVAINNGIYKGEYGRVAVIPFGMLARRKNNQENINGGNLEGFVATDKVCSSRCLEEISGLIGIEIIAGKERKFKQNRMKISLPVCYVKKVTYKDEVYFEKELEKIEKDKRRVAREKMNECVEWFNQIEKLIEGREIDGKTLEETKSLLKQLDEFDVSKLPIEVLKEEPQLEETLKYFETICERAKLELTGRIRVLMFS